MIRPPALLLLSLLAACSAPPQHPVVDAAVPPDAAPGEDALALPDAGPSPDAAVPDAAVVSPVTLAVIADLNGSYGSTTYGSAVHDAVAHLVTEAPDVVLAAGDLVAGQQDGLDYAAMWAGFHAAVTDPLTAAGIPLAVTAGNHDASGYSSFAAERAEFEQQWLARVPAVTFVDDASYPFHYAFSVGRVLVVSLHATVVGGLASEQRDWLDALLAAQAPLFDVTVVLGHLPLWPVAAGLEDEVLGDADLEAVLVARGVTLLVTGHDHAYYPGRRGAVRHLAMGCLGSGPNALVGTTETAAKSLVLLTVEGGAITTLEAYPAPDFAAPIPRETLPGSIGTGAEAYVRDDL